MRAPGPDNFPRVLVSDPAGNVVAEFHGVGWAVAWSPDSSRVATWLDLYPSTAIGIFGIDGVRQARVSVPPGMEVAGDFDPKWSPDGASLLVPLMVPLGTRSDVWELPVDGSAPRPVAADDPRSTWTSARSPDGASMVRVDEGALIVSAADGTLARTLVPEEVADWWTVIPVWSPGGDLIAFAGGTGDVAMDLQVVDVATGSATPVAVGGSAVSLHVIAFSPEGDRLLYARSEGDPHKTSLWSVRVDGSDPRLLVSGTFYGDWQRPPADGVRPGG